MSWQRAVRGAGRLGTAGGSKGGGPVRSQSAGDSSAGDHRELWSMLLTEWVPPVGTGAALCTPCQLSHWLQAALGGDGCVCL